MAVKWSALEPGDQLVAIDDKVATSIEHAFRVTIRTITQVANARAQHDGQTTKDHLSINAPMEQFGWCRRLVDVVEDDVNEHT